MTKMNLTENVIYRFIEEQKENIPVFSLFWEVMTPQNEEKKLYFEFISKPHNSNTIRPENFYKPIISIINVDDKQDL
jgi:hypothetical protein